MSIVRINTVFNIDLEFEMAPFHKRLLAYCIDFLILVIYLYVMKNIIDPGNQRVDSNIGLDILVISLPMLLYSLITELSMNGQTLGKKIMQLRVISLDGGEPTAGQFIIRWITKFFEWPFLFGYIYFASEAIFVYMIITGLLGIGALIVITVTPKNQRLGDLAAGTVVIDTANNMSVNDTVFMHINNENYTVQFPQVMRLSDNDINTIKTVITTTEKRNNYDLAIKVEDKIKTVLQINSTLPTLYFLQKLMEDYNYLATRE